MRFTARAILINNASKKILFIKYLDQHSKSTRNFTKGFWAMPGGGVEPGESFKEALKREIYEETGITKINVKDCVLSRLCYIELDSCSENLLYERYYIVETDETDIRTDNLTEVETESIKSYKWWSLNEIKENEMKENQETVFPLALGQYVDTLLENPKYPIDITNSEEMLRDRLRLL